MENRIGLVYKTLNTPYPYPCPFADAVKFGYTQVAINAVGVLLLFLAVGSVLNGIIRLYHKKS
jgi:hypothetical protein